VLLERAQSAFEACARTEEGHLLPAVRAPGTGDDALRERHVADSVQSLAVARRMFEELRDVDPGDPRWIARLIPLTQHVERRIEQHQRELFPLAKRMLGRTPPSRDDRIAPKTGKKNDGTASLWV
jgi:hypothetical protein